VSAPSPLSRLRVLDVAQVLAGPYCAQLLGDLGCDVVKVEPPAGDASRHSLGRLQEWGESAAFFAVNRNKRSIALDLKRSEGLAVFRRLARTADVVIESYRPGTAARLGIDDGTLRADNPRLVYASISGFGATGPYAPRGGYDIIAQGMSGIMSVTGAPGGPPAKAGVPLTDVGAGLLCAVAILGALLERGVTGEGRRVETSLFEAGTAYAVWEATELWYEGRVPGPLGSAHRMGAPYQAIRTGDGHITIGANNDRLWEAAATALGRPEWGSDPRFATNADRLAHRAELVALIEDVTIAEPSAVWLDRLLAAGVPAGPVHDYAQLFDDAHVRARELVVETEHPLAGTIKLLGIPFKGLGGIRRRPPLLGEHADELLRELGYADGEIERLRSVGAVG
jgi:formyl-CoA transferase